MPTRQIRIAIEEGELNYRPPVLHVKPGNSIIWICQEPFTIQFTGMSPFDVQSGPFDPTQPTQVSAGAQAGTYSYACAVYDSKTNRVYLDAACPAIIID